MKRFKDRLPALLVVFAVVLAACATPKAAPQAPALGKPATAGSASPAPQLTREQQLIEGAKKEGEVSLWVVTIEGRDNLLRLFHDRYPFLKVKIWDVVGADIVIKLAEEAKAGRLSGDVVIMSAEVGDAYARGLLTEYDFPNTVGWTDQPTHNFYRALAGSGRVVDYNTNLVPPAEVPRSWDDVKSAKWAEKTMVSTSGFDIPLLWAYLWRDKDKLNWDKSFAFWGDFFRNARPKVAAGYTGPLERLAAGEIALFPHMSTPATMRFIARGAPVGIAPLGKAPMTSVGLALVKNAPHPNAARLLIDFLTTSEGLLAYSEPTMMVVFNPAVQGKARVSRTLSSLGVSPDLVPVDLLTAENLKKSTDFWQKALGLRG